MEQEASSEHVYMCVTAVSQLMNLSADKNLYVLGGAIEQSWGKNQWLYQQPGRRIYRT